MPILFTSRFYILLGIITLLFVLSWILGFNILIPQAAVFVLSVAVFAEILALFTGRRNIQIEREVPERLSNGDTNAIHLLIRNFYPFPVRLFIYEELPEQLNDHESWIKRKLGRGETLSYTYYLKPLERGAYVFENTIVYIRIFLGLAIRRKKIETGVETRVYPSFKNMRRYELLAKQSHNTEAGTKKLRKIGHSMEFEQIKEYVTGDDTRQVNWNATARRGSLMVNHYSDERSQEVYCLIDKGRLMKMPFEGLTLLDYAINASLALCNVSLNKQDKFGLITFNTQVDTLLVAERKPIQLHKTLESLYKVETAFLESDYERLFMAVRKNIKQRSLLVLFTNFESLSGLRRQFQYLKQLAKYHLLLVVFFENNTLRQISEDPADNLEDVYTKTIAGKFVHEKRMIVREFNQHGIMALLCPPQNLTINVLNKYLELKSRQAI